MSETQAKNIENYWDIQPPFKPSSEVAEGTFDWYMSISKHRYDLCSYMHKYVGFNKYSGKRVVEIGCGAGTDLSEFGRNGAIVHGLDITDKAISLTAKRIEVEGFAGTVTKYNGRKLPVEDQSTDLVFSWGVLHHSPFMDDLFAESHRVLRPGGEMKLMLYHRNSFLYYFSILFLRGIKGGEFETHSRQDLLSKYSEFRVGCPLTMALTESEIKERLWFFSNVDTTIEFPAYDTETQRKLPLAQAPKVPPTGVSDMDAFFRKFEIARQNGEDLRKFGWHLLITAKK